MRVIKSSQKINIIVFNIILFSNVSLGDCIEPTSVAIPSSIQVDNFIINNDGTITNKITKSTWMRCLVGQTLIENVCVGEPAYYSWSDAITLTRAFSFADYSDWRLPSISELGSLHEVQCRTSFNATLFPFDDTYLWSSTSAVNNGGAGQTDQAWSYLSGRTFTNTKRQNLALLLVRDE
ncbi:DUF1566 domain-containing protein [Cellvibrio sp. pealriver]|uniref:Lcl C-terminal domain-containing protein n=1 Tax=Cellvibrio sp. pealriver TaxID=1622269 RepID=UPI0009E50BA3|nr:DUF1566 domain-containing protein [Cellvibrio sp. pealriver]